VDGVIWKTDKQKKEAVGELKRKGYQAQPLRRIFIPTLIMRPSGSDLKEAQQMPLRQYTKQ
jgi:RNA-directed DNA polymerase